MYYVFISVCIECLYLTCDLISVMQRRIICLEITSCDVRVLLSLALPRDFMVVFTIYYTKDSRCINKVAVHLPFYI